MKIDPLLIYFWQLADQFINLVSFMTIMSIIIGTILIIIGIVIYADAYQYNGTYQYNGKNDMEKAKAIIKKSKNFIICGSIAALLTCLIPSSKTIAMMVVIPAIANSEVIQKDVPELYNLAIDALKDNLTQKEQSK